MHILRLLGQKTSSYLLIFRDVFLDLLLPQSHATYSLENLSVKSLIPHFLIDSRKNIQFNSYILPVYSLFHYKDPLIQSALWNLKYKGNKKVASLFASMLHNKIIEIIPDIFLSSDILPIVIPLPSSRERYKEKGWNQTFILATALEKLDQNKKFIINTILLIKTKHTPPQATLNRKERLENLKGCFNILDSYNVKEKNFILLDDITTTGSTLHEATETLKNAGARSVIAFTIAR
jgi:ComF family protein